MTPKKTNKKCKACGEEFEPINEGDEICSCCFEDIIRSEDALNEKD